MPRLSVYLIVLGEKHWVLLEVVEVDSRILPSSICTQLET